MVACAGGSGSRPGSIEDIGEESWRADLDANLTATFLTIKSFLPGMKRRGSGSIITMSSAAGRRASAHTLVAYGAAKAGVQLLTQDLAARGPDERRSWPRRRFGRAAGARGAPRIGVPTLVVTAERRYPQR